MRCRKSPLLMEASARVEESDKMRPACTMHCGASPTGEVGHSAMMSSSRLLIVVSAREVIDKSAENGTLTVRVNGPPSAGGSAGGSMTVGGA